MVVALFTVASVLIFGTLSEGFRKWRTMDSRSDTQRRMARAWHALRRDLERANPAEIRTKRVTTAAGNGDVIWFLSAEDSEEPNVDERFKRDTSSGAPEWQRHIIYYLIRPANYGKVSNGGSAAIDSDPRNDYIAAHKFLIRKVVDRPGDEKLMSTAEIDSYTTAPNAYDMSGLLSEPGVKSCKLIADRLLSFEATVIDRTVQLDLRGVHVGQAQSKVAVGVVNLKSSPYTHHEQLRILMRN